MVGDHLPVVGRVVRGDEHAVVGGEGLGRELDAGHPQVVLAHLVRGGDVGVVVVDVGAEVAEPFDQLEAGALADVVDVGLVGQSQEQDA